MIKFNFTVSDVDAENIMSCLQDRINNENMEIIELIHNKHLTLDKKEKKEIQSQIDWYRGSIKYTEELKLKMKNEWVESK